jgi:hypothetical protein
MNEIEFVCECEHTSTMHSIHDGCKMCDCERNREDVVIIGQLLRIAHEFNLLKEKFDIATEALKWFIQKYDEADYPISDEFAQEALEKINKLE